MACSYEGGVGRKAMAEHLSYTVLFQKKIALGDASWRERKKKVGGKRGGAW